MLKDNLLKTGYFIDNEWLDKYVELIKNSAAVGYTEKHHVIPVSVYKYQYNCKTRYDAECIADKDPDNFLISLTFIDHCKAHLYLYNCSVDAIKHSNEVAFKTMVEDKVKVRNSDLTAAEEQMLFEWKNKILKDSSWYWYEDEVEYLKENYGKLTIKEIAKHLGRSAKAVSNHSIVLGITVDNRWTKEEHDWLVANRANYSLEECANYLNRSIIAVKQYCLKNKIVAKPLWTEEDLEWLRVNYKNKTIEECATHLNRKKSAISMAIWRIKKNQTV